MLVSSKRRHRRAKQRRHRPTGAAVNIFVGTASVHTIRNVVWGQVVPRRTLSTMTRKGSAPERRKNRAREMPPIEDTDAQTYVSIVKRLSRDKKHKI